MSGSDHLSPTQFGFHMVDHDEWDNALMSGFRTEGKMGPLDVNATLHTGQDQISAKFVEHYAAKAEPTADHDIEVYHHGGKQYLGDGHHRLAAARQNGLKSVNARHFGT